MSRPRSHGQLVSVSRIITNYPSSWSRVLFTHGNSFSPISHWDEQKLFIRLRFTQVFNLQNEDEDLPPPYHHHRHSSFHVWEGIKNKDSPIHLCLQGPSTVPGAEQSRSWVTYCPRFSWIPFKCRVGRNETVFAGLAMNPRRAWNAAPDAAQRLIVTVCPFVPVRCLQPTDSF